MVCDIKKLIGLFALICFVAFITFFYFQPNKESFESNQNGEITKYAPIKKALKKGETCYVKFYANWCPHCNAIEEDWNKFHSDFNNVKGIHIFQVQDTSSDVHKAFKTKHNFTVEGFPTIIRLDDSGLTPYEGERNYDGFKEFLNIKKS